MCVSEYMLSHLDRGPERERLWRELGHFIMRDLKERFLEADRMKSVEVSENWLLDLLQYNVTLSYVLFLL